MNIPAILSLFRVARDPSLCLPHATVATFADLPIPLSRAFAPRRRRPAFIAAANLQETKYDMKEVLEQEEEELDIRAVVLDKDNCFAIPKTDEVCPEYSETFTRLLTHYSPTNILIVSNSSGLLSKDPTGSAAETLERNTGVKVLRHAVAKPGCSEEIMNWFRAQHQRGGGDEKAQGLDVGSGVGDGEVNKKAKEVTSPSQVCVIGDRLFTDVVMANMMGARAIWIKEGAVRDRGIVTRVEYWVEGWLRRRGWSAREV